MGLFWEEVVVSVVSVESADSVSCSRAARMILPRSGHLDLCRKHPQSSLRRKVRSLVRGEIEEKAGGGLKAARMGRWDDRQQGKRRRFGRRDDLDFELEKGIE